MPKLLFTPQLELGCPKIVLDHVCVLYIIIIKFCIIILYRPLGCQVYSLKFKYYFKITFGSIYGKTMNFINTAAILETKIVWSSIGESYKTCW